MKNIPLSTATLIIIGLVIYILYLTQCKGQPKTESCPPGITTKVDSQVTEKQYKDTVTHPGIISIIGVEDHKGSNRKPKWKSEWDLGDSIIMSTPYSSHPLISVWVDTQAIIRDYFHRRVQSDSFVNEDVSVYVIDTVWRNTVASHTWKVRSKVKTITVTNTVIPPVPRVFYFGGGFHHGPTDIFSDVHVDLGYINRKGQHFKADVSIMNKELHYGASFYQTIWRIK